MQGTVDMVRLALEHVNLIMERVGSSNSEELGNKIRSRARELPSLLMEAGLVSTLLFYLAKAGERAYMEAVVTIPCPGSQATTGQGNAPNNNRISDTNRAYALIARATLCSLKEADLIHNDIDSMRGALEALNTLRSEDREIEALATIQDYILALKRVAEALWEEEEV